MLRNCESRASLRSRPEKNRQTPIETSRTSGCSMRLNQPANRFKARRGSRFVRTKFTSSRSSVRRKLLFTVMFSLTPCSIADSMKWAGTTLAFSGLGAAAVAASVAKLKERLQLSNGKHPSLAGHSRLARRMASLVRFYEYDDSRFFRVDGAPDEIAVLRRAGFMRLAYLYKTRFANTVALTAEAADGISDLQFTAAYRVPFQL